MKRLSVAWLVSGVVVAFLSAVLLVPPAVTAQDDAEPTIEAYQTQVAELESRIAVLEDGAGRGGRTPTPAPTEVPTRSQAITARTQPTTAPASTKGTDLPSAITELVEQDDPANCDALGWVVADEAEIDSAHHAACGDGIAYLAACQRTTEGAGLLAPAAEHAWILCWVNVTNFEAEHAFVSPMDFVLIDARNLRHDLDYTVLAAVGAAEILSTGELPLEQQMAGYVGFSVPDRAEEPFRLEIRPTLDLSLSGGEPRVIVLDRYME